MDERKAYCVILSGNKALRGPEQIVMALYERYLVIAPTPTAAIAAGEARFFGKHGTDGVLTGFETLAGELVFFQEAEVDG